LKNSLLRDLWKLLTSLTLTIITLIILSLTSIIGTLIPQNESPQLYLQLYSPSTYQLIKRFHFDDMYHSWWFTTLLALFTLNLISCSINRLPNLIRILTQKSKGADEEMSSLPLQKTLRIKDWSNHTRDELIRIVKKYLHTSLTYYPSAESLNLFAEKGKYTRLGFFTTHLGIVLIIIGGMLGNYGYQGFMKVVEGETSDTIILKGSSQQKQLDFSIRCDEFEVSFYQGSQRPKDFKSSLTIIEKGNDVLTKVIEVNDPLYYRGVYIYQSSYGTSPDQGEVLLGVEQKSGEKKAREYKAKIGERIALEQQGYEVEAKRFVPDFTIGKNKEVVSRSQELNNPAVQVALFKDGTLQDEQWIFLKFPDFHGAKDAEYRFTFLDFSGKEFTGLQLTKDPGVWVVWVGCILLTLGCYFVFFTSHRRLWVKVEEKKGEYLITIAGTSNKNLESFSQVFEQIQHECKQLGKTAS